MARKLKVYKAEIDGLHEWIVAAPNQAEALAAFGVGQDLFAQGLAKPTTEPAEVEAGAKAPGVALRRLKGSADAFRPADAAGDAAGWNRAAKAAGVKATRKKKPEPDRSAVDAAQAQLDAFEDEARDARAKLEQEQEDLDDRRDRLEDDQRDRRRALDEALVEARRAYEKAR